MADFPAAIDLSTLDGSNGFRVSGVDQFDYSGRSVSSAGDVNGDGIDDIVIGADGADPGGDSLAGVSYVIFGTTMGLAASFDLASLDGANGFRLDGINVDDLSGRSVSSAGDVNGDGFDDIIIGAFGGDPGGDSAAGESYVVFGKAGGFDPRLKFSSLDGANGFRLDGIDAGDYSGYSVASAGDVNGDGFGDIIIGARSADPGGVGNAGESYVVFGKGGDFDASLDLASLDGTNGFRLTGIDPADYSGRAVSSAGDVNGDGFDDVIVGAQYADPGGDIYAGESYVVFGKAGGFAASLGLGSLDGANGFRIDGIDAFDQSGISVSSAGDVNGDGFDDIIIGAEDADPGGDSYAGESYVVFGQEGEFAASFDLASLDGANGFRIDGIDVYDFSGRSVSSAGDVNGDGFDDVIIGAFFADPGGNYEAGESYVVFGKAGGFAASLDLASLDGSNGFRLDGIDAFGNSGFSVSSAGDVDGDGFDDIIIGARFSGYLDAGESYVVFGRAPTEAVRRVGSGADQAIRGGRFDDTLEGRGGDDSLYGDKGDDELVGGSGGDLLDGGKGADTLTGGAGDNSLQGGRGDDELAVSGGDNVLEGGKGLDRLAGGSGRDTLRGGEGDDRLEASLGEDELFGQAGNDVFVLDDEVAGSDRVTIGDFRSGKDSIEIDADDFGGGLVAGPLDPDAFIANATGVAEDAEDRFIYDIGSGKLFFDADGTGGGEAELIAVLSGVPGLDAGDFEVVGGGAASVRMFAAATGPGSEAQLFEPGTGGGGFAEMRGLDWLVV